MWTAAVNRLTETATLSELVAERAHHDGDRMLGQVERVVDVVTSTTRTSVSRPPALLTAAQAYLVATQRLLERIVDEGASTRDFSLLDPADYARPRPQRARSRSSPQSSTASCGIRRARRWRPPTSLPRCARTDRNRRQPRRPPVDTDAGTSASIPRRGSTNASRSSGASESTPPSSCSRAETSIELSAHLRASPWPAAIQAIVELAALDADERSDVPARAGRQRSIVDTDAHTTWTSDARLTVERPHDRNEQVASRPRARAAMSRLDLARLRASARRRCRTRGHGTRSAAADDRPRHRVRAGPDIVLARHPEAPAPADLDIVPATLCRFGARRPRSLRRPRLGGPRPPSVPRPSVHLR